MSFGYSVGDLFAGANLTYKLVRIMADTRGASDEYLQAMSEVSAMQQAFLQVGQIRAHKLLPPATVNATSHIVLSSVDIITAFLEKSRRYHSILENGHVVGGIQSSWYKVGWTLYKSQELQELRDALRSRLMSVQTLLSSASYTTPLPPSIATYRVIDEDVDTASTSTAAPTLASDDGSDKASGTKTTASSNIESDDDGATSPELTAKNKPQKPAEESDRQYLNFKDALGRKFSFPWIIAKSWMGMEDLIKSAFLHIDTLGPHVEQGWYDLLAGDGTIILPQVWDQTVVPGINVSMAMWPMDKITPGGKGKQAFAPYPKSSMASDASAARGQKQPSIPPTPASRTEDSMETSIQSLSKVANALSSEGNYAKAEAIYRQILALRQKTKKGGKVQSLQDELRLGEILIKQGKYEDAEAMFKTALTLGEDLLGKAHPDTVASIDGLAEAIYEQQDYGGSEKLHRDALRVKLKTLGKKHPSTLTTMGHIAESLYQQERYGDAETLHRDTLIAQTLVLGGEHEDTLKTMRRLSDTLYQQERYAESEELERELLELSISVRGPNDPATLATMRELATVLRKQEKYEDAERTLSKAVERMTAVHGTAADTRSEVLDTLQELAEVISKQGKHRHEEAEVVYRQALESGRRHFGEDDEGTLASARALGRLLLDAGRFAEAQPLLSETLQLRRELLDDDDVLLQQSVEDEAELWKKLRDEEKRLALEAGSERKAITVAGEEVSKEEMEDLYDDSRKDAESDSDMENELDDMAGVAVY